MRRITPEKQFARAMLKNKAAGHEAWMNFLSNSVKGCGLDVAQRSRLATQYGAKVGLTPRVMARRKGFEPLTPRFEIWQLSDDTAIAGNLTARGMSALLLKADMCGATSDVRFGPEADVAPTWA